MAFTGLDLEEHPKYEKILKYYLEKLPDGYSAIVDVISMPDIQCHLTLFCIEIIIEKGTLAYKLEFRTYEVPDEEKLDSIFQPMIKNMKTAVKELIASLECPLIEVPLHINSTMACVREIAAKRLAEGR